MKERHHVAIQMEEERQHKIDNGPIVKTADQLWKYSGYIESSNTEIESINFDKISKQDIRDMFSEKASRRADIIWKHIRNPTWSSVKLSKKLEINPTSIRNALEVYYAIRRTNKQAINHIGSKFIKINQK